jgi:hypothetical protein
VKRSGKCNAAAEVVAATEKATTATVGRFAAAKIVVGSTEQKLQHSVKHQKRLHQVQATKPFQNSARHERTVMFFGWQEGGTVRLEMRNDRTASR